MGEIPPHEYLDMANQAYVVAYVTGLVNSTFPHTAAFSTPLTAACATTLLYDYALTLREEVSATSHRLAFRPPDPRPPASVDHKNVDVSDSHTLVHTQPHQTDSHLP